GWASPSSPSSVTSTTSSASSTCRRGQQPRGCTVRPAPWVHIASSGTRTGDRPACMSGNPLGDGRPKEMDSGYGAPPALAVVVPTRNEADNVGRLIDELGQALEGITAEIIIVDDSDDETPRRVAEAAQTSSVRVGLIWRKPGEREGGLGGAVIAGLAATSARWVVVMDGDLQHPPALVPELLRQAENNDLDLVLASRFLAPQDG